MRAGLSPTSSGSWLGRDGSSEGRNTNLMSRTLNDDRSCGGEGQLRVGPGQSTRAGTGRSVSNLGCP